MCDVQMCSSRTSLEAKGPEEVSDGEDMVKKLGRNQMVTGFIY